MENSMPFRYYITDLNQGAIVGTNDSLVVENLSQSEDYFIVDSDTGEWVTPDGSFAVKLGDYSDYE